MSELLSHKPTVEVRWPRPDTALVVLGGEHDLATTTNLAETLDELLSSCAHLIVDLSTTDFIDSSAIRVLVNTKTSADERGRRYNLVLGSTPIVERALELTGVLSTLNRVRSVEEALDGCTLELRPTPVLDCETI
jgi:anti-anti-sigma factor